MESLKRTPLYELQKAAGGRFVPFAGWEMPVQFSGVIAEHSAVREKVGLFDVSHMGEFIVSGPEALVALNYLVTNDVATLKDGTALYTVMCLENGGIVDDFIIYREGAERFFICVNAGRRAADFTHMQKVLGRFNCRLEDHSDTYAQLALQGPQALPLLRALCRGDVAALPSFCWLDTEVGGVKKVRVARTGYTGEPGAELYCDIKDAPALWQKITAAGKDYGLALCGLACRDTLRLEMKYPLYGNDIDEEHTPLQAGLGWVVKFSKSEFVGRAALAVEKEKGPSRKWVGFKMLDRGIPRQGYTVHAQGREIGVVTSGTHSPSLNEPIGTAYVPPSFAAVGSQFDINIRDKAIKAVVVQTPFYQKGKVL